MPKGIFTPSSPPGKGHEGQSPPLLPPSSNVLTGTVGFRFIWIIFIYFQACLYYMSPFYHQQ